MKNLVALLCGISALVISAFSNECMSCDCNKPPCTETVINCPTNRCMTYSSWMDACKPMAIKFPVKKFRKGCGEKYLCGGKHTDDNGLIIRKSKHRCCSGDKCNNDEYEFKDLVTCGKKTTVREISHCDVKNREALDRE